MNRRRRQRERGQVVVFVVGITVALLLLAGLSIDGGRILSARGKALDEAQEAARTAAQQLDQSAVRQGVAAPIDVSAARRAAERYLAATGDDAVVSVSVSGTDVTVTVHRSVGMEVLGLVGIGPVTVSGSGTAHASRGTVAGT